MAERYRPEKKYLKSRAPARERETETPPLGNRRFSSSYRSPSPRSLRTSASIRSAHANACTATHAARISARRSRRFPRKTGARSSNYLYVTRRVRRILRACTCEEDALRSVWILDSRESLARSSLAIIFAEGRNSRTEIDATSRFGRGRRRSEFTSEERIPP